MVEDSMQFKYSAWAWLRGATLSGGAGATGTAFGDANQYALSFQGIEPEPAEEISTSDGALTGVLSGITVGS